MDHLRAGGLSAGVEIATASREDEAVQVLFAALIREADGPLLDKGLALDLEADIAAGPPADLVPPHGAMLLARVDREPVGIGGVRHLETGLAEVKSMFVSPAHRGLGLGRRILGRLEEIAGEHGCAAIRLDTSDYLGGAIALYRSRGYREVPDYNRNAKANLWFERRL